MSNVIHVPKRRVSGGSPAVIVDRGSYTWANKTNSRSQSVSIGAAPSGSNRRFVVAIICSCGGPSTRNLSSFTIGGSSGTTVTAWDNSGVGISIAYREINTGTTATIAWSISNNRNSHGLDVYTIETDASGLTVVDSGANISSNNPSDTLTVATDDMIVAYGAAFDASSAGSWNNGTTVISYRDGAGSPEKEAMCSMYDTVVSGDGGSYSATWTENGSNQMMDIAAFRGAAPV